MRFPPSLRFFRRNATPSGPADPADMGTAFGMEASIEARYSGYRQQPPVVELESQRAQRLGESPLAWMSAKRS